MSELNSSDSSKLVQEIRSPSGKSINHLYEISNLIDTVKLNGKEKDFNDLIFTGKYVNGLKMVLSERIVVNKDDYMEKIFKEFNMNLQKVVNILKDIISFSDNDTRAFFDEKYFQLNQQSMVNTLSLVEDLAICKEYLNENKTSLFL